MADLKTLDNDAIRTPVMIESPFAGEIERNRTYLARAIHDSFSRGEAPFASHSFYTQFLQDTMASERMLGIYAGYSWWSGAARLCFYVDYGMSEGMIAAFEYWSKSYGGEQRRVGWPPIPIPEIRRIGQNA